MKDVAIVYEKINTDKNNNVFILKPVDFIVGNYDTKDDVFIVEDEAYPSYHNIDNLKDEFVFFGNPISIGKIESLSGISKSIPDYEDIILESYYNDYLGDMLVASIDDDVVEIREVDLGEIVNHAMSKDTAMKDFVDVNSHIAIIYEKIEVIGTPNPTYIMKPTGVAYGYYNKETDKFIMDNEVYLPYNEKEALIQGKDVYFGEVFKVSDLIDFADELEENELEELSRKYFNSHASEIALVAFTEPTLINRMNITELTLQEEEKEETEKDESIKEVINDELDLLNQELNDKDKIVIYEFYRELCRFCYVEGDINGITKNDITNGTYRYALDGLAEIGRAIRGLGIDEEMDALYGKEVKSVVALEPKINEDVDKIFNSDNKVEKNKPLSVNHKKEETPKISEYNPNKVVYPEYSYDDLYKGITDVVIAQDEHVAKIVSVLYKRLVELNLDKNLPSQFGLMVTGSTGVGKSEIFKTFASLVDLPIQFMDATQISAAGYVGRDIETYFKELYEACDRNLDLATKAIMILDEVDKIKEADTSGKDVNGKAVQDLFLKLMDGTTYSVQIGSFSGNTITMSSAGMTPISIGAFTDMYNKKNKQSLGFGGIEQINEKEITTKDFIDYGMSDEFMGRHYIKVHLDDLNAASMLRILNESSKSPLKIQKEIFKRLGVDVRYTYEYKKAIVEEAIKSKTGARALAGIVANTTWLPVSEIDRHRGEYNKLIFNKETVSNPKKFILRRD